MKDLFLLLLMVSLLAAGACSSTDTTTPTTSQTCKDPLTGQCIPCPGSLICVNPVTCDEVSCGNGDIKLFGGDSQASDGQADTIAHDGDAMSDDSETAQDTQQMGNDGATTPANDVAVDASPADTATAGQCQASEKGCSKDGIPQFCASGTWLLLNKCPKGHACNKGLCECAKQCVAIEQKECLGTIAAIKTCELVDGCLMWGVPVACAPGQTCTKGQCTPPSVCSPPCKSGQSCEQGTCVGALSCGQIHACVSQFSQGANDQLTLKTCLAKGTKAAQALYTKRKDCIALACQTLIDANKIDEAMLCIYSKCGNEQSTCLGSGAKTCNQLGSCLSACGTSATCTVECHTSATVQAVKDWYTLKGCGAQKCAGLNGDAWAKCTIAKCPGAYSNCFGATGGSASTLNCKQILQCATGCAQKNCDAACKKSCADNCKIKGSAQGLSDLSVFMNCQKQYCTLYCNQGTAQQCNACIKAYCSSQDAKCGFTSL